MLIFKRKILFFFFYLSYKLIKCQGTIDCDPFDDCYKCVLCEDESLPFCRCVWTTSGCSYSNYREYLEYENWYSKILTCQNLDNIGDVSKVYCPRASSFTTESDLNKDNSITYSIEHDSKGFYGQNMIVCIFEYEQVTESDISLDIEFTSSIKKPPRVYIESTDITNVKTKASVEISRDIDFSKSVKVVIKVLLRDKYNISPVHIKLSLVTSKFGQIFSIIITVLFISLIVGCAVFCLYRMYKNNQARREARMYLYRQARENMARIEEENNYYNGGYSQNESIDIEAVNKEKLDQLFNGKMAQHLYKKEYNQYGGGCSICLTEFKKKSKVSITSCKHVFHYQCIHDWLYKNVRNPKCPNCNHEILNDADENNVNKEKESKIIKVKKKSQQMSNNNYNQNITAGRVGAINLNNGFGNNDISQSQRPQLGEY